MKVEDKWHDIPGLEGRFQVNCYTNQIKSLKRKPKYGPEMTEDVILHCPKNSKTVTIDGKTKHLSFKTLREYFYPKNKTKSYWAAPMTESGLVQSACGKLGLDLTSLRKGVRNKKEERPKIQAVYYYLINDLKFSTAKVGKYFDRDHSSAIWNKQNFEEAVTVYDDVRQYYELLKK